jgi:hypothetical protein
MRHPCCYIARAGGHGALVGNNKRCGGVEVFERELPLPHATVLATMRASRTAR